MVADNINQIQMNSTTLAVKDQSTRLGGSIVANKMLLFDANK